MAELDERLFASQYGLSWELLQQVPELRNLVKDAIQKGETGERFTARLENTNWWRTTSDTQRKFVHLRSTDPATFRQQWENNAFRVNQMAVQLGLPNLLDQGTEIGSMRPLLQQAVWAAMSDGWSDDRIKSWLGSQGLFKDGQPLGGQAAEVYTKLNGLAYANGRTYPQGWYDWWVSQIIGGGKTFEAAELQIRTEAASAYGAFATQIKAGMNAIDLASPYIRAASTLLELPEGGVGLNDKNVMKAMSGRQKDGSPYSLWQFENDVRSDPRWTRTNNAREDMTKQARQVLSDWGFAY